MSTETIPFDEDGLVSFIERGETVVRICHKRTGWYFGVCIGAQFDKGTCLLTVLPYCKSSRSIPQELCESETIDSPFVTNSDRRNSEVVTHDRRPFLLKRPSCIASNDESVIVIRADDECAVLSKHQSDILLVKKFLQLNAGHE